MAMRQAATRTRLLVVGGGPTGAIAALAATRRGFDVTLVEAESKVSTDPRAATCHPSTLEMIDRVGILDEYIAAGLVARFVDFWDKPTRTRFARYDHHVLSSDTPFPFVVQTEQHKLVRIVLGRLRAETDARLLLGHRVVDVAQDAGTVAVKTDSPDGPSEVEADYLIGCDGGRSTVRKALDIDFEGYTWPARFLVLTTTFDFEAALGCSYRNYFADPDEWTNLFKVAGEDGSGRWRAVFPTRVDETDDEALGDEGCARRLNRVLQDITVDHIEHRNLYKVHQRVASRFRSGRAFLAGDAAHVNNPIGGLGLNCGIHDVMELLDTLEESSKSGDQDLLDRYERRRRAINIKYVQEQTVSNKERLEESNAERRLAWRRQLEGLNTDPEAQRQYLLKTSLLASLGESRQIA